MKINPFKHSLASANQEKGEKRVETTLMSTDTELKEYQAYIVDEMEKAKKLRINKVKLLDQKSQNCVLQMSNCIEDLEALAENYFSSKECDRQQIKLDFDNKRTHLKLWLDENKNLEPSVGSIYKQAIEGMSRLPRKLSGDLATQKLRCYRRLEMQLNLLTNQLLYQQKVLSFATKNAEKVLKYFAPHKAFGQDIQVELSKIGASSDPHNEGASPLLVTFSGNNNQLKLVYKPRDARLDKKIIELFGQINLLNRDEDISVYGKSLLPEYKILTAQDLIHPLDKLEEEGSFWEYVEGTLQKKFIADDNLSQQFGLRKRNFPYKCVSMFVDDIGTTRPHDPDLMKKKDYLSAQLNKLENILAQLKMTDLQSENVIIRGLDSALPEIVPIDLEAIQYGNNYPRTGLATPEYIRHASRLTQQEQALVNEFKQTQNQYTSRNLPARTSTFMKSASSIARAASNALSICQELEDRGYELLVDQHQLFRLIERQLIQGDIPYFTELNNVIHIGSPKLGYQIASLKLGEY